MTRWRWAIGLLAAMSLVAVACTSDSGGSEGSGSGSGAAEQVTLQFWAHSGWNAEYYDALIAAFEAKYPNIHVDMTPYPEGQFATKVDTAIAAGKPPDMG